MSKSSPGFVASRQTSRTDCQSDQEHDEEALDPRIQVSNWIFAKESEFNDVMYFGCERFCDVSITNI